MADEPRDPILPDLDDAAGDGGRPTGVGGPTVEAADVTAPTLDLSDVRDAAETLDLSHDLDGAPALLPRADPGDAQRAEAPPSASAAPPLARPRIRWGGIVWGVVLAALSAWGVSVAAAPDAVGRIAEWAQRIEPVTIVAYALLAVGALVLVTGLVGLARRGQKRLAARSGVG